MMGRFWKIILASAALCCGNAIAAQETRVGKEGREAPDASMYELQWLIGQWQGEGIGGARAMESWLPPSGTTMVGTFVQETADGAIHFTEHLYLMEENGSLVLKLKHFNADLTGWEEKDGMLSFQLVDIEPCAVFFNGLTLRCDGDNGLVAAVRMQSDKPEPQELIFRFTRMQPETVSYDCDGTTIEMNQCMAAILAKAKARQTEYLDAALERYADRPDIAGMIRASDAAFDAYSSAECGAVWEDWKEGTIRTMMSLKCSIGLADKRAHDIWENWLTYMDSTPPVLPEPAPTQ
ncbi:DUF6265 family protein [Pontixanthobacter aestiaquae]|uniref:DUF1311 domain-containing protein n=1 Tax=Pontixanthobacter aestiaquae TaxID=1509367 RepID=A0A844Z4L1_9SPHN|nr:DUF6265 family protein [Pontixanthobacter aestiaquae]MDN3646982.1 DUF6265 family protein [Pontixanthobacter aestiaquae]MXO82037.1 DUF1311 domain-containing protein [Pontixanthobacter aestiaquae]